MNDTNTQANPPAGMNRKAIAFVGIIAGMLVAIIFGFGLTQPQYDTQRYWTIMAQTCAPVVCQNPMFEKHMATLQLLAQDMQAVDPNAKAGMVAAIQCIYDLQKREQLLAKAAVQISDPAAQKIMREQSDSCKRTEATADVR